MAAAEEILQIISTKGAGITQADIEEIEIRLTMIPVPEVIQVEEAVWEAVSLIINDPLYQGDAVLPDYDAG